MTAFVSRRPAPAPVAWRERSPQVRWWRLWRTRRPGTFNEKVRYQGLRDHRELMVTYADKAAVRDHVASIVGARILPHGSGVAIIVSETA